MRRMALLGWLPVLTFALFAGCSCGRVESDLDDAIEGAAGVTAIEAGKKMERQLEAADRAARDRNEEIDRIDGEESVAGGDG